MFLQSVLGQGPAERRRALPPEGRIQSRVLDRPGLPRQPRLSGATFDRVGFSTDLCKIESCQGFADFLNSSVGTGRLLNQRRPMLIQEAMLVATSLGGMSACTLLPGPLLVGKGSSTMAHFRSCR